MRKICHELGLADWNRALQSPSLRGIIRARHTHIFHTFFTSRRVSLVPYTFFFRSHISQVTSVSTAHKNLWGLTKKCVNRGLLTKKIAPSHKKSTEWLEWQEWFVLNSYEHKHCAPLRVRPVHNLNSIWDTFVLQYWIPILNYNSLMMPLFSGKTFLHSSF